MTAPTRQHEPTTTHGSIVELKELVKEFDTLLLTTITPEGLIRSRPMAVQDSDDWPECDLWFVTSSDSAKVIEIAQERQVGVCGFRPGYKGWLSISAWVTFERDRGLIRRLFKPDWSLWFQEGPDDPTIVLLKLEIERAEYWEPEGSRARLMYEMAKARLSGRGAQAGMNPPKTI